MNTISISRPTKFLLVCFVIETTWSENEEYGYIERMGISYISSYLKAAGHLVEIFYCPYTDDETILTTGISAKIEATNPDIIGYSVTTDNFWMLMKSVTFIKKNYNIPVVVGGPHAIIDPESIIEIDGVIGVCTGEGEIPMVELANAISERKSYYDIEGFLFKGQKRKYKRYLHKDIDSLLYPDRESYLSEYAGKIRNGWVFQSNRGCPYRCSFCSEHYFSKAFSDECYVRQRSVKNFIEEISYTTKKYPPKYSKFVGFNNPTFNTNAKWVYEFCKQYSNVINHPFGCDIQLASITEEMADWLSAANCKVAWIGFESGSDFIRKNVLNKPLNVSQAINKIDILRSRGIEVELYVMVGMPYETEFMMEETYQLLKSISVDVIMPSIFQPFPGTVLGELCYKEGWAQRVNIHNAKHISGVYKSILNYPHISQSAIQYYFEKMNELSKR